MERVRIETQSSETPDGSETSEGTERISGEERAKLIAKKLHKFAIDHRTGEQEAANAFTKLRELLAKYDLTIEEVYAAPTEGSARGAPDDVWSDVEEEDYDAERWSDPVDGKELLKELRDLLYRYVVMQPEQETAVALWILHAHAHDAAEHSPLLMITGPTQECGKTQLLQCVEHLVPRPLRTDNCTPAAIFDEIEFYYPTIVVDEGETFLGAAKHQHEMQGILNSGHKRGGCVRRKGRRYSTWAPKAIAMNGNLHATTESRSIIIRLDRKFPDEDVEPVVAPKQRDPTNPFVVLRRKCARWAADNVDALREADPEIPAELTSRTADNFRPLLAIGEACGWPTRARKGAVAITQQSLKERPVAEELLRDLAKLFHRRGSPLSSREIVAELVALEGRPWPAHLRGLPLTTTSLASLLKPFRIVPGEVRTISGRRANGYRAQQFAEAFRRYAR